jgi:hypothetical protein
MRVIGMDTAVNDGNANCHRAAATACWLILPFFTRDGLD